MKDFFITIAGQNKPAARPAVITCMEHRTHFGEMHALLKLARMLRGSAAQTTDFSYIHLFLRTACALEARVDAMAGTRLRATRH